MQPTRDVSFVGGTTCSSVDADACYATNVDLEVSAHSGASMEEVLEETVPDHAKAAGHQPLRSHILQLCCVVARTDEACKKSSKHTFSLRGESRDAYAWISP